MKNEFFRQSALPTSFGARVGRSARRAIRGATVAAIVAALSVASAAPPKGEGATGGEWKIAIRPREESTRENFTREDSRAAVSGVSETVASQPGLAAPVSAASGNPLPRMTYAEALASIPFNREEYEANPSYRHDAALEMMFGAMRPTMVVKQNIPYFSRYPDFFRNRFQVFPYPHGQGATMNTFSNWTMNTYAY